MFQRGHFLPKVMMFFLIVPSPLLSQVTTQEKSKELTQLYAELDSLFADETIPANLFELADSILALENMKVSTLLIRTGYVSSILTAGRSLSLDQYGFSSGLSYFHHNGFFASVAAYTSDEYNPSWYLSEVSGGFTKTWKGKLTGTLEHGFYIYHDTLKSHLFHKTAQASLSYSFNYADLGIDYNFLYGNEESHRISATANLRFKWIINQWIDAITFMPGASFQWGNADVLYWRQPRTAITDLYQIVVSNDFPRLTRREYLKLTYLLESNRELASRFFLRERNYQTEEIKTLMDLYYSRSVLSTNTFGFMNYSFSFPVIVRAGKFSLLVNYTYNLPQSLPGETVEFNPTGYFSTSLSYMINWIRK